MFRSMTGYGRGTAESQRLRITVELRSVNHRFADVRVRMPSALGANERLVRKRVLGVVKRGRVEGSVQVDPNDQVAEAGLNRRLLDDLLRAAHALQSNPAIGGTLDLATVLATPGMLRPGLDADEWEPADQQALEDALARAAQALAEDRTREGEVLKQDLARRAQRMTELARAIGERIGDQPERLRTRINERLESLRGEVELDPQRVAQEVVHAVERADVTEERVRLDGHLTQLAALLAEPGKEPLGKRLEFLVQEIQRETNTINAKSSDLELSRAALDLKVETEKVREQIQNVE